MAAPVAAARRGHMQRVAWALRAEEGLTCRQVAERLGVDASTVSRWFRSEEARLGKEFQEAAFGVKVAQTERLEAMASELWADYRASKGEVQQVTVTSGRAELGPDGGLVPLPDQRVVQTKWQAGDAALAGKALDAMAAVRKLWGLEAPKALEVSGPGGGPVQVFGYEVVLPGPPAGEGS